MYIRKSVTRNANHLHADFQNAVHDVFSINTQGRGSNISVNVRMRSYSDNEARSYEPIVDDGRYFSDREYSMPYSELEFQESQNPMQELERASIAWLVSNHSDFKNGEIVSE